MGVLLDDLLEKVKKIPPSERALLDRDTLVGGLRWIPNPGPQTDAYRCKADELFYGGSAGGGKTDLILGLSVNEHTASLVLRKYIKDSLDMADRMLDGIIQSRDGWNGTLHTWKNRVRTVDFGGCQTEDDKQRFKGVPHDLIAFDEISDFSESQFRFIATWNRTTKPGQRCRVVCTGNPPTTAEGLWVIQYWGPWLDPTHPNPARDGELRWYTTGEDGRDMEVDGPGPHMIGGRPTIARSRTFIRGWLSDNPDLAVTNYDAVLSALPERERAAYRDGRFDASIRENPAQVIPTAWIRAAQARWTPLPPAGVPMCAMAADIAQGGSDNNVIASRYDGWYPPLIVIPGSETPLGTDIAGTLISKRRDKCPIIVDCGGGYGGPVFKHLKDNDIEVIAYKGSESSNARTKDQSLRFYNKRAEVLWRFREALDPDQPQGSTIALPPDTILLSDLAATTYETESGCIKLETVEKLNKRLGRSIDRGVAVVLGWSAGNKIADSYNQWRQPNTRSVLRSHPSARRRA